MTLKSTMLFVTLSVATAGGCVSAQRPESRTPPSDPLARTSYETLQAQGIAYANAGDSVRAQQYLSAALLKGAPESVVIPQLVRVCISGSRLRAALQYAQPYVEKHPDDSGMQYVVGAIHRALGDVKEAQVYLHRALNAEKPMEEAAYELSLVGKDLGDVVMQEKFLSMYVERNPKGRYALRSKHRLQELRAALATPQLLETPKPLAFVQREAQ